MNITSEKIDDLNTVVKVTVSPADYKDKVETTLSSHRKQVKMPGFRQGKVPMGLVKKMYGNSVLADELNRLLNDSLYGYLKEEKIEYLGNPLPKEDAEPPAIDINNLKDFEFAYEVGLAPDFDYTVSDKEKVTKYKIKVDDSLIDKYQEDLQKQMGKVETITGKVGDADMLQGEFLELDENNETIEGGIFNSSTISLESVEDAKLKKALMGLKEDGELVLDPRKVSRSDQDLAAMLGLPEGATDNVGANFRFTLKRVYRMQPADLDQAFFDRVAGEGTVTSLEELRKFLGEQIEKHLDVDSDRKLRKDIEEKLVSKLKLKLPDGFLKRWLLESQKELTAEQLDKEYEQYADSLKWQLIENKIIKNHEIEVSQEEALDHATLLLKQQYAQYGMMDIDEAVIKETAVKVIQNQEEARRIFEQLYAQKIFDLFKTSYTIKEKEVSYDEFVNLVTGKNKGFNLENLFKFKK